MENVFLPFTAVINFMNTYQLNVFGFHFTFMNIFIYSIVVPMVFSFIKRVFDL